MTTRAELIEAAASKLLDTEWEWRVAGPYKHTARDHYSADCPLCRPDYGDNAQRIVAAVLAEAVPLITDAIEARREFWGYPGELALTDAARLVRQLLTVGQEGTE